MKAVAAWNRSRGKNYYDTLGVEMDSNESDIKAAYDREAWRCHPNRVRISFSEIDDRESNRLILFSHRVAI